MFGDKGQGGKSSREGTRRVSGGRRVEVERLPRRGRGSMEGQGAGSGALRMK